ncbi:DUF5691 domain-containing protein [Arthrobacter sp. HMWF013]|uniref:DUF5691 domain-containing protein n=1 Tax=Arthrobacter sp. HMWF013 TaxID=2056849 RepID=UPI000D37BE48|nr:DUF5691 domain-containing protein [Arthrobacter sp. HMWF013]PTT61788.1 hypothetical protein DBR22_18250 [Arthrobacter sp. HMWF013]
MTWLAELRTAALVGTARHPAPTPSVELGALPPDGLSSEESLLEQAALADAATRAARRSTILDPADLPEPAPPDNTPQATGDAARLLELLLTQPPVGLELRNQLVTDWLRLAEAAGQRVPHRLLPKLLELADNRFAVAESLHPAIGVRGRWLEDLKAGVPATDRAASADWTELKSADATTELGRLRREDPAAAREQLASHWDTLAARERAAHLATFSTNLSDGDEELLERALDDKAKSVRDVAAGLLDRLPASARSGRMADRLRPLVHLKGVLRKQFEIGLPPEPDAAALRDGIPPDRRTGEPDRLARLDAVVRGAPLEVWTAASGRSPAATLALLKEEPRILETILATAALQADLDWVRALLDVRTDLRLLNCLPRNEREDILIRHIKAGTDHPFSLVEPLRALPRPWGLHLAGTVLDQLFAKKSSGLASMLADVLPAALPPEAAEQARRLLEQSDADAGRRRVLRDAVQYHSFRQSLTEAFR